MHAHAHTHKRNHACACACACVCMHACVCVCAWVRVTSVCVSACLSISPCACARGLRDTGPRCVPACSCARACARAQISGSRPQGEQTTACARGCHPVSTREYTPPPPDSPKVPLSSIAYPPSAPLCSLSGVRSTANYSTETNQVPLEYPPSTPRVSTLRGRPYVCNRAASYPTETAPQCRRWGPVEVAVEQVP